MKNKSTSGGKRPGAGRPATISGTRALVIRLSDVDHAALAARAAGSGQTISAYVRSILFS